jgi:hypothetical protein
VKNSIQVNLICDPAQKTLLQVGKPEEKQGKYELTFLTAEGKTLPTTTVMNNE